jgi:transposase/IS5 family transposase
MIERIGDKSIFTYIGLEEAMAKYKSYDYSQRVMIPVSLEEQLVPGTLEFAIQTLVEDRMDMAVFEDRYRNDEMGRMAYDPKILLKVVLLGYARGLVSSRKMEQACRENVTFMTLACGQRPDHSTIAAFVSSMQEEIVPLFRDVLLVGEESGLLGGTFFALDGCKLPSNASKEWSGKISDLVRKKEKMEKRVTELLRRQVEADKKEDEKEKGKDIFRGLNRTKQMERLRRKAEGIRQFLKENGAKIGRTGKEIKSNVTDNESANMMTSHGVVQGYNGQAVVDGKFQVIVHGEAFGEGQDHYHAAPMVEGTKGNLGAIGHPEDCLEDKVLVADSNYSSPANLEACREEKLDAYIPDKKFRTRDPRFATQERWKSGRRKKFGLEDFRYQRETDKYVCPNGKVLHRIAKKAIADGIIYRRYVANREDCLGCELRARCLMGKIVRRRQLSVPVGVVLGNLLKEMAEKVDTERGREIYHQRIGIAEPVFANIRAVKGLDRFTLRGKIKVNIQWVLYCMVHNIGKIMSYGFA